MINRHYHGDIVWVDATSPTPEEVRLLVHEFGLDPLVADELLIPSARNRVDAYQTYLYLVLHFPAFRHSHDMLGVAQEIDFIVGTKFVITTRYDTIDPLQRFSKVFEVQSMLEKGVLTTNAGEVFYNMLMELYRGQADELAYVGDMLDQAEERVFRGEEARMVVELSKIGRDLLNFTQALSPHREVLDSLETPAVRMFGYEFARNVRSARGEYDRLEIAVRGHHASLRELRETNNALLSTKQNEVMRLFTVLAFIMFPLSLIAGVFGMNTSHPLTGSPHEFWVIIGIMAASGVLLATLFKLKRWL